MYRVFVEAGQVRGDGQRQPRLGGRAGFAERSRREERGHPSICARNGHADPAGGPAAEDHYAAWSGALPDSEPPCRTSHAASRPKDLWNKRRPL